MDYLYLVGGVLALVLALLLIFRNRSKAWWPLTFGLGCLAGVAVYYSAGGQFHWRGAIITTVAAGVFFLALVRP